MILMVTNPQLDGYYASAIDECTSIGYFPNFVMPGFLTSSAEEQYIEGNFMILWNEVNEGANLYPFYIGYHRNAQNNWVWYDYDLNDVETSGYTNWGPGYPTSDLSKNCTVIDSKDGVTGFWKNVECNSQFSLITDVLCFSYMCHAESYACLNQLLPKNNSNAETVQKHHRQRNFSKRTIEGHKLFMKAHKITG
uniref:C-type lectin domain-containing protein n=1 Tax=Acrobeloides nanus TaxID=290746 RepID=A0A914DC62_9BILA